MSNINNSEDNPLQEMIPGTIFVGRERELASIDEALAYKGGMTVIISGVPGSGKTSLVHRVVQLQRERGRFPGGIIWIDCSQDTTFSQILTTIASNLDIKATSDDFGTLREAIISHLRVAPVLLVFDSYELVAQEDEILAFLGHLGKRTNMLIISRVPVRLPGRTVRISLDSFGPNETRTFLRRYLNQQEWAQLTDAQLEALHQATGGLPLALALIAGLLHRGEAPSEVIEQLQRADNIVGRPSALTEELLSRTVETLSKEQRRLLEALAVFTTSVDGEVLATVAGMAARPNLVKSLEVLAFVQNTGGRYSLHPLVRAYFQRWMAPQQLEALQRRMVKYFLEYATQSQHDFDELDREWPNIQQAIEIAWTHELWEEFIALVLVIGEFVTARNPTGEYERWLRQAIEASERYHYPRLRAGLWHNLGVLLQQAGNYDEATTAYERSLNDARATGDQEGITNTLTQLATVYYDLGQFDQAENFYREILAALSPLRDPQRRVVLSNLGMIAWKTGRYEEAEADFQQALAISRQLGDSFLADRILYNLGSLTHERGRYEEAEAYLQQALTISRQLGDRRTEAAALQGLGSLVADMGRYEEAEAYLQQALDFSRQIGDRYAEATIWHNLGSLGAARGRHKEAEANFERALAISQQLGDRYTEATIRHNLGSLMADSDRYEEAERFFQEALTISQQLGDQRTEATVLNNLGRVYSQRPGAQATDLQQAIRFYSRALELLSKDTSPLEYATVHTNLGGAYVTLATGERTSNLEQAIKHYQKALETYTESTFPRQWAETLFNLGNTYRRNPGRSGASTIQQAIAAYQQALQVYTRAAFPADWLRVMRELSTAYAESGKWPDAKEAATSVLDAVRGGSAEPATLEALIPWYEQLGEQALHQEDPEFAARIFATAAHRFELQGAPIPEVIHQHLRALKAQLGGERMAILWAEAQGELTPQLAQHLQEARQLMSEERFSEAEVSLSSALTLLARPDRLQAVQRILATICFLRGICRRHLGNWNEALQDQEQAFTSFEHLRDPLGQAHVCLEMGQLLELMNNYEAARIDYMDAYHFYQRANNQSGLALASEHLGRLEFQVQLFAQAVQDLEEARLMYLSLAWHLTNSKEQVKRDRQERRALAYSRHEHNSP